MAKWEYAAIVRMILSYDHQYDGKTSNLVRSIGGWGLCTGLGVPDKRVFGDMTSLPTITYQIKIDSKMKSMIKEIVASSVKMKNFSKEVRGIGNPKGPGSRKKRDDIIELQQILKNGVILRLQWRIF